MQIQCPCCDNRIDISILIHPFANHNDQQDYTDGINLIKDIVLKNNNLTGALFSGISKTNHIVRARH